MTKATLTINRFYRHFDTDVYETFKESFIAGTLTNQKVSEFLYAMFSPNTVLGDTEPFIYHSLKLLEESNPSKDAPYHGTPHSFNMTAATVFGIVEASDFCIFQASEVIIAALWHDYGHSAGKLEDKENIEIAVSAFYKEYNNYLRANPEYAKKSFGGSAEDLQEFLTAVEFYITGTQYPYIDVAEKNMRWWASTRTVLLPRNDDERMGIKILRDADMCMIAMANRFEFQLGLFEELYTHSKVSSSFFPTGQVNFLKSHEFNLACFNVLKPLKKASIAQWVNIVHELKGTEYDQYIDLATKLMEAKN